MFNLATYLRRGSKKLSSCIAGFALMTGALLLPVSPASAAIISAPCSVAGTFTIQDHVVTTSTENCAGDVVIPADVTVIGQGAFSNRRISSVTFEPNSQLTEIATYSFEFTDLTSIDLPTGLMYIDATAFTFVRFTSISIPGTVESIGWGAFYGTPLTSVTFEPRVTANIIVANGAFVNCNDLISINFTGPVEVSGGIGAPITKTDFNFAGWSTSVDGPVSSFPLSITGSGVTTLYPEWTPQIIAIDNCSISGTFRIVDHVLKSSTDDCAGDVTIPSDVTQIASGAFSRKNITGVNFESGGQLTRIAEYAFEFTNITSISLPSGLKSIAHGAFTEAKFTSLSIPGTVEAIEGSAFYGASIETVVFEPRVALTLSISYDAFIYTRSLRSVTFSGPISFEYEPFGHTRLANDWLGWSTTLGGPLATYPLSASNSEGFTLYPNVSPRTYTATYDSQGGTAVAVGNIVGGDIQFPASPTRTGYSFDGWFDSPNSWDWSRGPVTVWDQNNGATFYAKWIPNTYAVNFDAAGGTSVPVSSFVTDGDISSAPEEPTKSGYLFAGWAATQDGAVLTFPYSPGVMQDITLFAQWTPLAPTITLGTAPDSQIVTIPAGLLEATMPATDILPSLRLIFAGNGGGAVATVTPTTNPENLRDTPFVVTGSTKFVDIHLTGISGNVTICLDGESTKRLFHFTGGAWVELPNQSYVNGQVCGVTSSFSPFAAAVPAPYKPRIKVRPSISGNAQQNTYLKSTYGTWKADPLERVSVQWYRCEKSVSAGRTSFSKESNCKKIAGATKSRYKVVLADQGKFVTAMAKATNTLGSTFSSAKSIRIPMATMPTKKTGPKISGAALKGNFVTASVGTWRANPVATTSVQWYRCDTAVPAGRTTFDTATNCSKIAGATKPRYKIAAADQSKYLTALVKAKNSQGFVETTTKSVRVPGIKPSAKASPKVSGSAKTGNVLRATFGTWSAIPEASTTVQWYRCATSVAAGMTSFTSSMHCKKISGATNSRYTVVKADEGKYLTVLVKAKNADGTASSSAHSIRVKVTIIKP